MEPTTEIKPVVKFGFGQLNKRTPDQAKKVFRVVLYTVSLVCFICNLFKEIPPAFTALVEHYALYAVALVHFLSKMFGITLEEVEL